MRKCVYKNRRYKVMCGYDGFQAWEKVSKWDIFQYVKTFDTLKLALDFVEGGKK